MRTHRSTGPLVRLCLVTLVLLGGTSVPLTASAQTPSRDAGRSIVVTTGILGSIVRELVGDEGEVTVLMEGGVDPHAWAPSARETEAVFGADLVVANGLRLEEGVVDVLDGAAADGIPVFLATDHVTVRPLDADAVGEDDEHAGEAHAGGDPHFWLDPLAMRAVVLALVPVLADLGVDAAERAVELAARLEALDAEVGGILAAIPPEQRRLVTGHESMGYFADRYGFELVGAVVPGLSSHGEVSARELATLAETVRAAGVDVVFTEVGTPDQIAAALASETGARVVEVTLEQLPPDGSYESLIRDVAATVADALGT
jgi:zinc/manganese transport system substrate-binding protein